MYLKIKTINFSPDKFGNNIVITKIGLYDESDKWIKWVKLDNQVLTLLENQKIYGYNI
jgi:hypothetical protein